MIQITNTAADKIKEMLASENNPNFFLRLGVSEGGCSGFSYTMGFDEDQKDQDHVHDIQGLKVVVDDESIRFLNGLEIDYKESAMGGGFALHNPNAYVSCGCGSSFRTRTEEGKPDEDC